MSKMMENIFYKLSLKNRENTWNNALLNSFAGKIFIFIKGLIEKYIVPLSKESIAYQLCESLTLFSVMLLVFSSPFVSTGMNAALVLFAVLSTTLKHFIKPDTISKKSDILIITILMYFGIALISAGFSPYLVTALKGYAKMIIYFLTYLVFLVNINNMKDIRFLIWSIIISSSIVSAYGVYQFYIKVEPYKGALWDDPNSTNYRPTRVYSYLKNPNLLAAYLLPVTSLTAAYLFLAKSWKKIVILIALYLQLACTFYTYSRGGWIGAAAAIGALFLSMVIIYRKIIFRSKFAKIALFGSIGLGIVAVIGLVISSPAVQERISSIFTLRGHSSNSFRMNVWIAAYHMFEDFFIIGIGPGNDVFNKIYPLYMFSGFKALSAYNIFLETGIEMGIIGLIIFIYLLFVHSCRVIWGIIADIDYNAKIILAGCLAGLSGLLAQGMVDTVWYRPQVHIFFWLILALIAIVSRDEFSDNNGKTSE